MATGIVTWFKEDEGCGLITPDEGDRRYVVHWSGIAGWPKKLAAGARVDFEIRRGPRGYEAVSVTQIGAPEANGGVADQPPSAELTPAPLAARSEPGEAARHLRS